MIRTIGAPAAVVITRATDSRSDSASTTSAAFPLVASREWAPEYCSNWKRRVESVSPRERVLPVRRGPWRKQRSRGLELDSSIGQSVCQFFSLSVDPFKTVKPLSSLCSMRGAAQQITIPRTEVASVRRSTTIVLMTSRLCTIAQRSARNDQARRVISGEQVRLWSSRAGCERSRRHL